MNQALFRGLPYSGGAFPLDEGQARLARFRRYIDALGNQYGTDLFYYTIRFQTLNRATTQMKPINIERDSAFDCLMLTGGASTTASGAETQTQPVGVTIIDSVGSRNLMSGEVPMSNLIGNGANPFVLPIKRPFMPRTQINVAVHNYATGTDMDHVNITLVGRKRFLEQLATGPLERFSSWQHPQTGKIYCEDFYIYEFNVGAVAASATATQTIVIERDSDFEWLESTWSGTIADAIHTPQTAAFDIQIRDGGGSRFLVQQSNNAIAGSLGAVDVGDIAGTGLFPSVLMQPKIFLSSTPVTLTLTNNDSGNNYTNVHFSMIGRKIFEFD